MLVEGRFVPASPIGPAGTLCFIEPVEASLERRQTWAFAGIDRARAERPGLIVLDLLMPEASGFDVVRELRAYPESREIPILVFTVKDLSAEERERLRGSVQAVVTKGATGDLVRELARMRPTQGKSG